MSYRKGKVIKGKKGVRIRKLLTKTAVSGRVTFLRGKKVPIGQITSISADRQFQVDWLKVTF